MNRAERIIIGAGAAAAALTLAAVVALTFLLWAGAAEATDFPKGLPAGMVCAPDRPHCGDHVPDLAADAGEDSSEDRREACAGSQDYADLYFCLTLPPR
jgi:hypothetical protein